VIVGFCANSCDDAILHVFQISLWSIWMPPTFKNTGLKGFVTCSIFWLFLKECIFNWNKIQSLVKLRVHTKTHLNLTQKSSGDVSLWLVVRKRENAYPGTEHVMHLDQSLVFLRCWFREAEKLNALFLRKFFRV